jgi:hypothetical protein
LGFVKTKFGGGAAAPAEGAAPAAAPAAGAPAAGAPPAAPAH